MAHNERDIEAARQFTKRHNSDNARWTAALLDRYERVIEFRLKAGPDPVDGDRYPVRVTALKELVRLARIGLKVESACREGGKETEGGDARSMIIPDDL